ncbi:unnamed protein product, partial [Ectocarpus sp. 13 AM-2016]
MESPVRSVETGENGSGGAGGGANQQQGKATAAGQAGAGGAAAEETSPSQRFEAKSYLERQVEELSCADEDEAQEKVSQRLQFKQDQAQKKRDVQLQRRRKGIAERLRKIGEAREAVDARFAENAAQLMERQTEKQTSATRRRRTSLENIKNARAMHNRRVNQRRRESFDDASGVSPARIKGMHEFESKLARAERNRDKLRRERRRRAMERYEEGKARVLEQGALASSTSSSAFMGGVGGVRSGCLRAAPGSGVGGGITNTKCTNGELGRDNRRRRAAEARHAAKARQTQRMRSLRQRMLSHTSRVSERKTRLFAARLLQAWWRCVREGKSFDVAGLAISISSSSSPGATSPQRSPLGSPTSWATAQGLGLSVPDVGCGSIVPFGDYMRNQASAASGGGPALSPPVLDPCTRSPIPTSGRFSPGVGGSKKALGAADAAVAPVIGLAGVRETAGGGGEGAGAAAGAGAGGVSVMNVTTMGYGFGSHHKAALAIQAFLRRNMHPLKVANALLAGRLSIKVLCAAVRTMSTSTFDEAIDVMSTRAIVSHCETALKALRMGREMRCVPQTVRSARAFLSALLVNFFPTSALDDEGALSSTPEGTAPLKVEKDRLVRAAGNAIQALLGLETTTATFGAEHFPKIRRASATMVRARVAFCRRFAEWKRKDAVRLADEMTAASVDVLFMQLRAERDLHVAAVRYGIDDADDEGALFSTGFEQIKEGTQRQLGKMMHALGKLVGADEARQRMNDATNAAFERLRADELAEDEAFLAEHGAAFAEDDDEDDDDDENMDTDDSGSDGKPAASASAVAAATAGDGSSVGGASAASEAAAALLGKSGSMVMSEEDDIAGPRRPLSAGDLLSNEWLVHEVMISGETLTVSMEEAIENQLLRSGNPAVAAGGGEDGVNAYWSKVESHVAAEDYTPLLGLVAELRDKIIGLTPRRRDLAAETCEAMDVELLEQMMDYGAFDVGCFFRMVAFAGERVLELEAPIRNDDTKATLAGWGRTQDEVEGGRRRLEPAMVRECFEYLFSKTDEIHVDILNAHLQFVTPFLKQHGVEYERDRFTEKLDVGEISLDMTHLWLHRAIRQLRSAAGVAATPAAAAAPATAGTASAAAAAATPPPPLAASPEVLFYRELLSDLEQRRGDAYLKLLRVAIVDNLLGSIVCVERKVGSSAPPPPPPAAPAAAATAPPATAANTASSAA